jgi:TRAP-type C4-dicarboxylate transport system substrate-binding protein
MTAMDANASRWLLANEYPATSLCGEGDARFAQLVSAATLGRLAIDARPDASLGYQSLEQVRAVARGEIAMADSFAGALGEEHPVFALSSLPFVVANLGEARGLYEAARGAYDAAFAERNQKLLHAIPWPASGLWTRAPVNAAGQIAALTIRTYDRVSSELFARLGAHTRIVSFSELAPRLASGEIDAVLSSGDGGAGHALRGRFANFTDIRYAIPLSFTTVNLDLWRSLDAQTRAIVEGAALETETRQWHALEGRLAINHARMRAQGVTIETLVAPDLRARLREAAREAIEAWAALAGPEAAALLASTRANAMHGGAR